jgi:D-3-phosphoglycerate dehydrogenase
MKKRVLLTDYGFSDITHEKRLILGGGFDLIESQCKTEEEVIALSQDVDALLVQWAPITRRVISQLRNCSVIVRYGIGVDNIDLEAAKDYQIPVCNVPDYCVEEVASHTIALSLALQRRLVATDQRVRQGVWQILPPGPILATSQSTFIVMGYGRIARSVAGKAAAMGFQVKACDPFVSQEDMDDSGVTKVSFEQALAEADILSLHLPLNGQTRHAFNRQAFEQMKRTAILINTSRGGLIDTHELALALSEGILGGAGLDVFEKEPLENDHPLRHTPNTLLTSHTAWYSEQSIPLLQRLAAEEVCRGLSGQPLKNRVV